MMQFDELKDVVGQKFELAVHGVRADMISLPHTSGASTWPGSKLSQKALKLIKTHRAWAELVPRNDREVNHA